MGGGEARTIIVTCATGGTIEREVERTSKSERDAYVDSQRAFGRDSLSLRACSALVDAGITNIVHMEGGMAAWKAAGLAVQGSAIKENAIEGLPWLGTGLEIYGTDKDEEVLEKKPSIFGIAYQSKAISAWPVVYSFLVDMKQPLIVTCDFGGTLDRGLVTKYGREYQDPEKAFGSSRSSLRACYELIQAGYTNVSHLDGGNMAWKEAKLPMKEQFTQQIFWENKGAIVLVLLSLRYFFYLLEN